jgi:hypothetical protein
LHILEATTQGDAIMKVISILLAFLNSLIGGLLILSCVSAGESLGWVSFKSGAGLLAVYFGIMTFKDNLQPIRQSRILLNGIALIVIGISAVAWGIHWSITSGDTKNTVILFGGSLFVQGLTSVLGIEADGLHV